MPNAYIRGIFHHWEPFLYSHLDSLNWFSWLVIALIMITFEAFFGQMFLISLAIGAVFASIAMALGCNTLVSVLIFIAISLFSLLFLRKRIIKILEWPYRNSFIIGQHFIVDETIPTGGYGSVLICGEKWQAFAEDGEKINKGACVVVVEVINKTVVVSSIDS